MSKMLTPDAPAEPLPLTKRQTEVFRIVAQVYAATEEGCSAGLVGRRLGIRYHEAVRGHFAALFRKGWLRAPGCPAVPRFLDRSE